jgi:hypothetical protein
VLDGDAVLLGVDGRSNFNGLHSRRHDEAVVLCVRLPLFAMSYVDGDRWVAVSRAPDGRGFSRREVHLGERLHAVDEITEPPVLDNIDGDCPRLRAIRRAR